MNFAQSVKNQSTNISNRKLTENGAVAYSTLSNDLLDLFATIGALRPRSEQEIEMKFSRAFAQDRLLATKMMFYCGNIRGGLGERRTFRVCLKWLANNHPEIVNKNMSLIPLFNRWDSIFVLVGTPCEERMWRFVEATLKQDMRNMSFEKSISLLAKWMPSENTSSQETRKLARVAMKQLGLSPRSYRKILSKMREYLDVIERKMSANEWEAIKYNAVPSYAMKNYSDAFRKHDYARFTEYLNYVKNGKTKINASTLYPYDLVHKVWGSRNETAELQWKSLPNYVEGENNYIVMADVSGSMMGRPIETSISLATYFAERNAGDYHGLYMTFSSHPNFITLDDNSTLYEKVCKVRRTEIGYSTNLMRAFEKILSHAVQNHISPENMPKALIVVSDMEIDQYFRPNARWDFLQVLRKKFADYGYECPKLIMWNVEARHDTFLSNNENVLFVSGQSASTFKQLCANLNGKTAWDLMIETLNDKMYDCVRV